MKMKHMLIASAVAVTAFWSTNAYAVSSADLTVESVSRSFAESNSGGPDATTLAVGDIVYFDVKLKSTVTSTTVTTTLGKASYEHADTAKAGTRPALLLNIPLKGLSSVATVDGNPQGYKADVDVPAQTSSAVAYYVDSTAAGTLRFAYVVRPGDMVDDIDLARNADGSLRLSGTVENIKLSVQERASTGTTMTQLSLDRDAFDGSSVTAGASCAVNGFAITVGDAGKLYKGLVPVTVAMPADYVDQIPAAFTSASVAAGCKLWVEDANGNLIPAKISVYRDATSYIAGADADNTALVAKDADGYSKYAASVDGHSTTAPFVAQTFYVSIPQGVTTSAPVRICYGMPSTNATYSHVYAAAEFDLLDSPVVNNTATSGYTATTLDIPNKDTATFADADLLADFIQGGSDDVTTPATFKEGDGNVVFVSVPAGSTATVEIDKNNIDRLSGAGTLYAIVEQISQSNANVSPDKYVVPLYNATGDLESIKFTAKTNAKSGQALYRVHIPGLSNDQDTPMYIVVMSSTKVENITISVAETGDYLQEYRPAMAGDATTALSIATYTASVESVSTAKRYFVVHPVFSNGTTEITEDYYYKEEIRDENDAIIETIYTPVVDLLKTMLQVQSTGSGVSNLATDPLRLVMTFAPGETAKSFYVAALNDFASKLLNAPVYKKDNKLGTYDATDVAIKMPLFAVRAGTATGRITGNADICSPIAAPTIANRAPFVTGATAAQTSSVGATIPFAFSIADAKTDYIVVEMNFDEAVADAREYRLIANDEDMIQQMGEAKWNDKVRELEKKYYGEKADAVGSFAKGGACRIEREGYESQVAFTYSYDAAGQHNWSMTAYDSSGAYVASENRPSGLVDISSAQKFTFNVYNTYGAMSASGFIAWAEDVAKNGTVAEGGQSKWTFTRTATSATLGRGTGTTAAVVAIPFSAGTNKKTHAGKKFDSFIGVNPTKDSFFYKWAASEDYIGLLPLESTDPLQSIYSPTLQINRMFAPGDAEVDPKESETWADIVLSAIFTLEYDEGDALRAYSMETSDRNGLFDLGDYNMDGVPDGWLIANFTNGRELVETNVAATVAEGDRLPFAGWNGGDTVYAANFVNNTLDNAGANDTVNLSLPIHWTRNNPQGPCSVTGEQFTYKQRIRGRDDALNAGDGHGNWLSAPAWVVALRPAVTQAKLDSFGGAYTEKTAPNGHDKETFINAGTLRNDGSFVPSQLEKHKLYMGSEIVYRKVEDTIADWEDTGIRVARTERHQIPYLNEEKTDFVSKHINNPDEPQWWNIPQEWHEAGWRWVLGDGNDESKVRGFPLGWNHLHGRPEGHMVLVCTDKDSVDYEQIVDLYNYALDYHGNQKVTWAYNAEETFVDKTSVSEETGLYTATRKVRHFIPVYDEATGANLVYPFTSSDEMPGKDDAKQAGTLKHLDIRELGGKMMLISAVKTEAMMRQLDPDLDGVAETETSKTVKAGESYPVWVKTGTVEIEYVTDSTTDPVTTKKKPVDTYAQMTDSEGNLVTTVAIEEIKIPNMCQVFLTTSFDSATPSAEEKTVDTMVHIPMVDEAGNAKRAWIPLFDPDAPTVKDAVIYETIPQGERFLCYELAQPNYIGINDQVEMHSTATPIKVGEGKLAALSMADIEALDKTAEDYAEQMDALIKATGITVKDVILQLVTDMEPASTDFVFEIGDNGLLYCTKTTADIKAYKQKMYLAPVYTQEYVDENGADATVKVDTKTYATTEMFAFHDWLVPAGIVLDEYFTNAWDPLQTCWLDRFGGETNGGDIVNGVKYYFWYYASRMRFASAFQWTDEKETVEDTSDDVTYTQINTSIWPAIDIRDLESMDTTSVAKINMNGKRRGGVGNHFGMPNRFVMGRRLRNDYNPDAEVGSPAANARPNHKSAMGNYWDVITANDIYGGIAGDPDNDGYNTIEELALGTNPLDCDTDNDWMPDGWEAGWGADDNGIPYVNPFLDDANENPDNDFYARLEVKKFGVVHDLYEVEFNGTAAPADARYYVNTYDADGMPIQLVKCCAYYDAATKEIRFTLPANGTANPLEEGEVVTLERFSKTTFAWDDLDDETEKINLTNIVTDKSYQMETNEAVILKHHDVYTTVGFSPYTAWAVSASGGMIGDARFQYTSENTTAFTNMEEYNTARLLPLVNQLSPVSMDTNGDGIPDGWSLYVDLDPTGPAATAREQDTDEDGLTTKDEFICQASVYSYPDLGGLSNPGWTNKLYPTDPNNSDTDFDGIEDGQEGSATFIYTADGTRKSIWEGRGLNPCSMDTDCDGMSDGYEFYWGTAPQVAEDTTEDEENVEGEDPEAETEVVAIPENIDPTYEGDVDIDVDHDGLTNYQEYMTSAFRHFRYDLSPSVSRLYTKSLDNAKGVAQWVSEIDMDGKRTYGVIWKSFPDTYNVYEDLMNPDMMISLDYVMDTEVNPIKVARASADGEEDAALRLVNYLFARTIALPTESQIDARKGLLTQGSAERNPVDITTIPGVSHDSVMMEYATKVKETATYLAAIDRLAFIDPSDEDYWMAVTAIHKVDEFFSDDNDMITSLKAIDQKVNGYAFIKTFEEGQKIWAARRDQIVAKYKDALKRAEDTYRSVDNIRAWVKEQTGTEPDAPTVARVGNGGAGNYATTIAETTCPLLQAQVRMAYRGYNGGLWREDGNLYFGPLGYIKPGYLENSANRLGDMLQIKEEFLTFPTISTTNNDAKRSKVPLFATSPISSDSDLDGMDDYWEIVHGLNPLLGDYREEVKDNATGRHIDMLQAAYLASNYKKTDISATYNPVMKNAIIGDFATQATGFDYYSYPWFTGVPFADPDGDGLVNSDEAPNGEDAAVHHGTDPSPLWMTDPSNMNSFTLRFYGNNLAGLTDENGLNVKEYFTSYPGFIVKYPDASRQAVEDMPFYPFEVNEGFDTDGDGIADGTEVSTPYAYYNGDPQDPFSPTRNFAAYFGGEGAMQTPALIDFGPTALRRFTVECWILPDDVQNETDVVLVDRPWSFSTNSLSTQHLRHNFILGLEVKGDKLYPYACFTATGGSVDGGTSVPAMSARAVSKTPIGKEVKQDNGSVTIDPNAEWTHVAATYDGNSLRIYVNGKETNSVLSSLLPATGVVVNSYDGDWRYYNVYQAPFILGATPTNNWIADTSDYLSKEEEANVVGINTFGEVFTKCYKGYMDEVRIWNGARTETEIAQDSKRTLTKDELLTYRLTSMIDRLNNGDVEEYLHEDGEGIYENTLTTYPVAVYTFNNLPSSTEEDADNVYEVYPGQKLIGDETIPGSFTYRRSSYVGDEKPQATDLFCSYYDINTPDYLKSTKYGEERTARVPMVDAFGDKVYNPTTGKPIATTTTKKFYEYVPKAINLVSRLPIFDIEVLDKEGNPRLHKMETSVLEPINPKMSALPELGQYRMWDTCFWRKNKAGDTVDATVFLKVNANPYAYRYEIFPTYDQDKQTVQEPFTVIRDTDLMVYGDAFTKYSAICWEPEGSFSSPDQKEAPTEGTEGTPEWFLHNKDGVDTGDKMNDIQLSVGGQILETEVRKGATRDTDGDKMPDWWETYYGLDYEDPIGKNGPYYDNDGDFLTNYAEYLANSNPGLYSTAGNDIPDFHVPLYYRRGAPVMGLLYSDADFMEDHWEATFKSSNPSVDSFDMYADPDHDGWSNFAEARVSTRGVHSTNPLVDVEQTINGKVAAYPTPALSIRVDCFEDLDSILNSGNNDEGENVAMSAKVVVHAFTVKGNMSAPDAIFVLPFGEAAEGDNAEGLTQIIGRMNYGTTTGYLEPGNIKAGSVEVKTSYYQEIGEDGTLNGYTDGEGVTIRDDGNGLLKGFFKTEVVSVDETTGEPVLDEDGKPVLKAVWSERAIGTINYITGEYSYTISEKDYITDELYNDEGKFVAYFKDIYLKAAYEMSPVESFPATYTFSQPLEGGHIREGKNNFFVFLDLNGNNMWNEGEPAGVPDQHDVDIGYDTINRELHVALTKNAPPGAVRVEMKTILDTFIAEKKAAEAMENNGTGDAEGEDDNNQAAEQEASLESKIKNPLTGDNLKWSNFLGEVGEEMTENFKIIFYDWETISNTIHSGATATLTRAYEQDYNTAKPYITEDEIFAANPTGLSVALSPNVTAMKYLVCYAPVAKLADPEYVARTYGIATAINNFGRFSVEQTHLRDPESANPNGGKIITNTDLAFEWASTTQLPSFDVKIVKTMDAAGIALAKEQTVFEKTAIRGVSAIARSNESSSKFYYRYEMPNAIGDLNSDATALFGNGSYKYVLTLHPYTGTPVELVGYFQVQLTDSRDLVDGIGTVETYKGSDGKYTAGAKDTTFNALNSYYVRANIRYNGVLNTDDDFSQGLVRIEAHYSASFNGTPVASTSDYLNYDGTNPALDNLNHTVIMEKDKTYVDGNEEIFHSTLIRAELRGLASDEPVYLVAYFDLNMNGKRDTWEPWGYLAKGATSSDNFYYDPMLVTPKRSGTSIDATFYIQDVDVDGDKLADAWEWIQSGRPSTLFADWCNTVVGGANAYTKAGVLWTEAGLTSLGAQVFGFNVLSVNNDGIVDVGIPAEAYQNTMSNFGSIMPAANWLELAAKGYTDYSVAIKSVVFDGNNVALQWSVEASKTEATGTTETITEEDITDIIAKTNAVYNFYGKETLSDEWTLINAIEVSLADGQVLKGASVKLNETAPKFFKVVLEVKTK